ncbi:MAG: type II toxin-antitoxin system VapB family antitoxin [Ignavibacteria bacterium]|nr:type II toxin-antitoxin system VapB family antitoxin [Ignavibacteria bacterium]MCC7158238.1 type II toxin-antitoxin system VapB family antitoxin [Ignavibacteria bacterium]
MRTNIDINDTLIKKAKRLSRIKTKKEIINAALEAYVKDLDKRSLLKLKGKIKWSGNFQKMRESG